MQLMLFQEYKFSSTNSKKAKPFLKWAGGKTQILSEIDKRLPRELKNGKKMRYIEPFVGSGAVLFHLLSNYNIEKAYIIDINENLINLYKVIKNNVCDLIEYLKILERKFLNSNGEERKKIYYSKRKEFNKLKNNKIKKAALLIFLNRTCYNGLYRVNSKGEFNVPFGRYKNPKILDEENLINVSLALKNVEILCDDFEISKNFIDENTFVYIDPPYRPLSNTSNFTSYFNNTFDDNEQIRLKNFFDFITNKGAKILLSNSDPKNTDPNDNFFDELYKNYIIERILAKRMINSKGSKRGYIYELLIRNYYE
ncbi:N-6 DNA methylase [Thermosipho melanesiensis]|uniref:Site-specific DNA-methyltransferase (adenine-specific) n=2 Tax=Thermosipho melanesiensis TaxID=46541 RepID=A6LJS9_THEM4|nr:Dam family site-specific DNA-(adenine-N6)-methyltransferase [Thermosipho melanesiensis]ABR30180.1 DNA adenine methylase [Thermosipho melanesiensis BI429]APT73380.1 modification methylase [Thermosipho melanesiensis]OOC38194.1 N-6 DNA methylase [Thermosipho melanesiensis]OOC40115.1 N-6 DNA methylase [Thermosipho melanesiensis]OOC40167.1 N-6 DNA methylase [Thermosipho melanesiensis]